MCWIHKQKKNMLKCVRCAVGLWMQPLVIGAWTKTSKCQHKKLRGSHGFADFILHPTSGLQVRAWLKRGCYGRSARKHIILFTWWTTLKQPEFVWCTCRLLETKISWERSGAFAKDVMVALTCKRGHGDMHWRDRCSGGTWSMAAQKKTWVLVMKVLFVFTRNMCDIFLPLVNMYV